MGARRKIKVVYKKLGRERIWGQADEHIEIDPRLIGKGIKHLEVLIHEALHVCFPYMSEEEVEKAGVLLAKTLWSEHYRRVDNSISKIKLQDGKL
jgi:hypothetical protein